MNVVLFSTLAGVLYFQHMEKTIPTKSNCSYVASPWTDHLATICGLYLMYTGKELKRNDILFLGTTILVEHILQYVYHKRNRPLFIPITWEIFGIAFLVIHISKK